MKLLYNGRFYLPHSTGNPVTAMIVGGDTILALGSDDELLAGAPLGINKLNLEGENGLAGPHGFASSFEDVR